MSRRCEVFFEATDSGDEERDLCMLMLNALQPALMKLKVLGIEVRPFHVQALPAPEVKRAEQY